VDLQRCDKDLARYLFLHVPKTAGSTFRNIAMRNFNSEAVVENPYMSEQCYSQKQIERLFFLYPYRFFLGHVFRLRGSLEACGGTIRLISFSRDPVEKAISAYYYLRGRDMTHPNHPVKSRSFAAMVDYVLGLEEFDSFDLDSSQTDWLVGEKNASVSEVRQAVASGRLAYFPSEAFDVACLILERKFPDDFKDCSYARRVNVAIRPVGVSREDREAAERLPWIARDRELHDLARQSVAQMTKQYFSEKEDLDHAMDDFLVRCDQKIRFSRPRTLKMRIKSIFGSQSK